MRPFQNLVTTYARPNYNELDPTFLIAITFPLLFGAMFGDIGQGLVLAVLGWLLANRKIKALNSMAGLGGLIMACGAVAAVFGLLYGRCSAAADSSVVLRVRSSSPDDVDRAGIVDVVVGVKRFVCVLRPARWTGRLQARLCSARLEVVNGYDAALAGVPMANGVPLTADSDVLAAASQRLLDGSVADPRRRFDGGRLPPEVELVPSPLRAAAALLKSAAGADLLVVARAAGAP